MIEYSFQKADKKVTLNKFELKYIGWNFKKEYQSDIIENFNFFDNKLKEIFDELITFQYKITGCKIIEEYDENLSKTNNNFSYWVTISNGNYKYYKNNKLHREDGPAIQMENGTNLWYINGLIHKDNDYAIEWNDGRKEWFQHGSWQHIMFPDGTKIGICN